MKIKIDQDTCIGCASCVGLCPNFYEMNTNETKAHVKESGEASEQDLQESRDMCPVGAISWDNS